MKKIKIILIGLIVIIMTGCSGNYNLIINEDLSIDEELDISINNTNDSYQKSLNIFEENNIEKEKYNVSILDDKVKINYKEKYSSLEDYILNGKIYHQLFDNIQYNKNDDLIDITVNENIKLKNNNNQLNGTDLNDLDVIQINITNPFKVKENNSEIKNDNVYTWSIKNSDVEKKIMMKFQPVLDVFPYKALIVGIIIIIVVVIFGIILLNRYRKTKRF